MPKKFRSVTDSSTDEILSAAPAQFSTKSGKSSLKTLISTLPPSSPLVSSLPPALHQSISETLDSFKMSTHDGGDDRSPPPKRSRRSSRTKDESHSDETLDHLKKLQSFAYIAQLMLSHPKKPFAPSDVLLVIRSLHDSLVLYESDPALLSQVANLCEQWWKEDLPGKESLISQSLPFFLSKSLSQGKKSDVRRVYVLREAFTLFDYVDESIDDVRLLLIRCVIAPVYLKTDEGRKFVAFMVGLNDRIAKEALALIKSQIPFGRKSVLEAYAEILFRAWKVSEGSLREEIENEFVQGLIDGAVHAGSKQLAASVRRVLGGFIEQRATDGVEKLLFRLSEPLLFRSLQVANSNVRQNALHLLLDIFPLEDPDSSKAAKDTLLDKQFFLIEKLLLDDCPDVRAVAVEGTCRILNLFWEVIPSSVITKLLARIIDSMSHDVCNEVRLSTVNGLIYLLDNPQSHEIMKVLLPRLGCLLSDPALSVRVATTDLLLAVRDIRTFQFNKIVSLDALLSSLANDHCRVAQKVTRLLIPSYFPSKMSLKEACGRCIALLKRSPTAGARFCEFALSEGSSPKSLMELLRVCVSLALSPKNLYPDQIDGLFVASANICRSLSCEPSMKTAFSELFSTTKLKCLFSAAASLHAKIAVLTIASLVSSDELSGFRNNCIVLITSFVGLADNIENQALVREAHKLMLSYGWKDELFGALTSVLQSIASGFLSQFDLEVPQRELQLLKKKRVKLPTKTSVRLDKVAADSSKAMEDLSVASEAAWQLKDLLINVEARNSFLKSPNCEITFACLRIISQVSIEQCMHWDLLDMSAIMAYTMLALHMSLQSVDAASGSKNNAGQNNSLPPTVDDSLCHLLNCAEWLFGETDTTNSCSKPNKEKETTKHHKSKRKEVPLSTPIASKDGELKNTLPEAEAKAKAKQNVIKMAASIFKFIADAATIGFSTHNHLRCLRFASAYVRYILSSTKGQQDGRSPFKEDDQKDVLVYLKCSITYASKLLHLVLTSSSDSSAPAREAFYLANDLLDLLASLESDLGSRYASHVVTIVQPWLPVLVLGLGATQLIKATQEEGTSSLGAFGGNHYPLWLTVLGKAELYECTELSNEEQDDQIPEHEDTVFKKLMESVVALLKKGNSKVLDAVGHVILSAVLVELEREEFGLSLGLLHFTCVKLLNEEFTSWKELEYMPSSLKEIYIFLERELGEDSSTDDGRHFLESARELLRSFSMDLE